MKKWCLCLCLLLILAVTAACNSASPAPPGAENPVIGSVNGENVYQDEYDFFLNNYFNELFVNYDRIRMEQGIDILDEENSRDFLGNLEYSAWQSVVQSALVRQIAQQEYNLSIEPHYTENLLSPSFSLYIKTNLLYNNLYPLLMEEAPSRVYEENPADWDCRQVAHIIILPEEAADEETADEEAQEAAKAAAKAQVEEIIARLDAGEDFAELAAQYSKDGTAENGGVMELYFNISGNGISEEASFDSAFAAGAFALNEIGDYSAEPVESSFGYHIIKLLDKKEGFEEVKDFITTNLANGGISSYFTQKVIEKEAASTIECNLEFKYYTE